MDCFHCCPEEVDKHKVLQYGRGGEAEARNGGVVCSLLSHQEGGIETKQRDTHVQQHLTKHMCVQLPVCVCVLCGYNDF